MKHASFFETTFTFDGHKTENQKVQANNKMPQPTKIPKTSSVFGYHQVLKVVSTHISRIW